MDYPTADEQMLMVVRAYQQGFNDRQMGREKRTYGVTLGNLSYNLGWHDGKPRSGPTPQ